MPSFYTAPATRRRSASPSLLVRLAAIAILGAIAAPLVTAADLTRRSEEYNGMGFHNPSEGGGSWLTLARNSGGLGEPINIVVSANSDAYILTTEGLTDFMQSVQYSEELLGQSLGARQAANLGDGNGQINQTALLRYNYFDIYYGTLKESIEGGSHVRYWRQNGTLANSGAWFVSASVEMAASENHMIVDNGYDLGRDEFTGNATAAGGTISPITNRTFSTTSVYEAGFLPANSSEGINHGIATDGRVAILTVRITNDGTAARTSGTSGAGSLLSIRDGAKALTGGVVGLFALAILA